MKKLALPALIGAALVSSSAFAAPIGLPAGPLYFQYNNAEQFSATNAITSGVSTGEGLWGIAQISVMVPGIALTPTGSDISGGSTPFFVQGITGQVTGVFYGLRTTGGPTPTTLNGGYLDLWWADSSSANVGTELGLSAAAIATKRSNNGACYTGFACDAGQTFLARLKFSPGINAALTGGADLTTTDVATVQPGTGDGVAKSYLDIDLTAGGVWATALDTNWFTLDGNNTPWSTYGLAAKDVRLDTNFSTNGAGEWSVTGTNIVGLRTNDPGRAFVVPEPASLALFGVSMFGLALTRRRKEQAD